MPGPQVAVRGRRSRPRRARRRAPRAASACIRPNTVSIDGEELVGPLAGVSAPTALERRAAGWSRRTRRAPGARTPVCPRRRTSSRWWYAPRRAGAIGDVAIARDPRLAARRGRRGRSSSRSNAADRDRAQRVAQRVDRPLGAKPGGAAARGACASKSGVEAREAATSNSTLSCRLGCAARHGELVLDESASRGRRGARRARTS